jgi:starvation-inducible DNA-binding protein
MRMKPNIGLSDSQREGNVSILNDLLSDEYVLYTKTRNYHWNVFGPQFNDLHKFFEGQYEELDEIADQIAERARSLGGWAFGTLTEFVEHTKLKEYPKQYPDARQMLSNLLTDHELLIRKLRVDLDIIGTNDFLMELLERHEKMAWMLRGHLEGEPA